MNDTDKCMVHQAVARFNLLHDALLDWHRASAIHSSAMGETNHTYWRCYEVRLRRLRTQSFRIMCKRLDRHTTR